MTIGRNVRQAALALGAAALGLLAVSATRAEPPGGLTRNGPIVLLKQGSFFVGGEVLKGDDGDTAHVGQAFVEYQVPVRARRYPLVMWHGGSQTGKTFESTPDGRDGYQQIFSRNRYPVYILDQAGRGRGGRLATGVTIGPAVGHEANIWSIFRLGPWEPPGPAGYFPNVAFPRDPAAIRQFMQQDTIAFGPDSFDRASREFHSDNTVALLKEIGPSVIVTHSNSGQYTWYTAMKAPELVKAIVGYENGTYVFPQSAPPPAIPSKVDRVNMVTAPVLVPDAQFKALTRMPIILFYGDNIDFTTPSDNFGIELWRVNSQRAQQFVDAVNKAGGNARLVFLPKVGLVGNTHFAFADLNNFQVAQQMQSFLHQYGLDAEAAK